MTLLTPANINLSEGQHTIIVSKEGYIDYSLHLNITKGEKLYKTVVLNKIIPYPTYTPPPTPTPKPMPSPTPIPTPPPTIIQRLKILEDKVSDLEGKLVDFKNRLLKLEEKI